MRRMRFQFLLLGLAACQANYSADDAKAAGIGVRNASDLLDECASDDAGTTTCQPTVVRTRARIIFCASQHALVAHATPFDGGPPCTTP